MRSIWATRDRSPGRRGDPGRHPFTRHLGLGVQVRTEGRSLASNRSSRSGVSAACIELTSASSCAGPQKWLATWSRSMRCSRSARARRAIASITSTVLRCVVSTAVRSIVTSSASAPRCTASTSRALLAGIAQTVVEALVAGLRTERGLEHQQVFPVAVGERRARSVSFMSRRLLMSTFVGLAEAQGTGAVHLQCRAAHESRRFEHRNATTLPKSSGSPMRPAAPNALTRSVACSPGHARFSVMPSTIRSWAAVFAHAHRPVREVFEYARLGMVV